MDHEHTEDDPGQTIYVLKRSFQQSVAQLFSVDNLTYCNSQCSSPLFPISFTCLKRWMLLQGKQTELLFVGGGVWNSESNSCTQAVFILETYSVRIIILRFYCIPIVILNNFQGLLIY